MANDNWFQTTAAREIHLEQLKQAERFNGRAAMLGIAIGVITEGLTGAGIAHQIGLGPLVDGYAACRTQFLPLLFLTPQHQSRCCRFIDPRNSHNGDRNGLKSLHVDPVCRMQFVPGHATGARTLWRRPCPPSL